MGLEHGVLEAVNRARAARGEPPLDAGPSFRDPPSAEDVALAERIGDEVFKDTRPRRKETDVPITYTEVAKRQNVLLRGFFMGPTGSGKSLAALELASRIFDGQFPITLINTEVGRGLLYADRFPYHLIELDDDFSPHAYEQALDLAEEKSPGGTVVVDSVSHEWMGANGVLQQADRFGEWKKVRPLHNAFVQRLLRVQGHVIVTCRAKMKYEVGEEEVGGRKRQTITMLGVGPVQSDDLQYEFNLVARFDQETKQAEFSGHIDALQGTISSCVGEGAQQVASAITGWCSAGEPPPPFLRADPAAVAELSALLLAEGIPNEKIEQGFNAAKGANRGALHPEWVAEKLKAARERAAAKADDGKAAAGPQEAVSGDGAGEGGSTVAEPVGAGTGAQEAS